MAQSIACAVLTLEREVPLRTAAPLEGKSLAGTLPNRARALPLFQDDNSTGKPRLRSRLFLPLEGG
jgi:hypothetical protein